MKRIVTLLAFALLSALPSFAWDSYGNPDFFRHSVYAGYSLRNSSKTYVRQYQDTYQFSGVLDLGYEYRVFKMLGVGADIGWMNNSGDHRDQIAYPGGVELPVCTPYREDFFLFSANVRGIWLSFDNFSLYSAVRAGLALGVEGKSSTSNPNFQLIPVGVELGVKRIGAYAEVSLGTITTISFGARYHF